MRLLLSRCRHRYKVAGIQAVGFSVDLALREALGQDLQGSLARRGIGDQRRTRENAVILRLPYPGSFRLSNLDGDIDNPSHHHEQSYSHDEPSPGEARVTISISIESTIHSTLRKNKLHGYQCNCRANKKAAIFAK